MATRSKSHARRDRDEDTSESLKPLVVLVLLGTILYGAWSVVSKGPTVTAPAAPDMAVAEMAAAPAFAPQVEIPPVSASSQPAQIALPVSSPVAPPQPDSLAAPPPAVALPAAPPAPEAAAAPTYLSAASAAPPVADPGGIEPALPPPGSVSSAGAPPPTGAINGFAPPASTPPTVPAPIAATSPAPPAASGPAFASAWADAHDKLAAGRYAEALAVLSTWYDDPSLGLEESQRLEDLLGQLAGTVIYSQQDLLLPPYVVEQGETLQSIAAPLGVPWQLLAKINGVADPARLVPGEALKVVRGPFDAVVSISRRRLSLRVGGSYAGSFGVIVGRGVRDHAGTAVPVLAVQQGGGGAATGSTVQAAWSQPSSPVAGKSIALAGGLAIEAVTDPAMISEDTIPGASLLVSERDLADLADILGPGSKVLLRQ